MRLRTATLNTWALPDPFGRDVATRMRAIGTQLAALQLDAISFQEVWTLEAREILLDAGRRAGLAQAWHSDALLGGGGLLVLSRLPIEAARFERFTLPGVPQRIDHPDYYGGKGFVRLRLATAAGPLSLIDTHLHARYAKDVTHQYRAYRVGEVVQIAMNLRSGPEPVVLAGDFNFREQEPEYRVLRGLTGVRDVAVEAGHREATVLRANPYRRRSKKGDRRIDFVFVRDGRRHAIRPREIRRIFDQVFEVGGRPGSYSNHAGLLTELEIDRSEPRPLPPLDPEAVQLASQMLAEGRNAAERQRRLGRTVAGGGLGAALLASACAREQRVTRRRLLRTTLQAAGLVALTPGVGFSILSEVFAPSELRAYDRLAARLVRANSGSESLLA